MLHHRYVHHIKSTSQRTKQLLRAKILWSAPLLLYIKENNGRCRFSILYGKIRTWNIEISFQIENFLFAIQELISFEIYHSNGQRHWVLLKHDFIKKEQEFPRPRLALRMKILINTAKWDFERTANLAKA